MMTLVSWFAGNWGTIVQILGGLLGVGSLVTGLTPSPKDDEFLGKARKFVGKVASVTTFADAPGTFKAPGQSAASAEAPLIIRPRGR